MGFYGKGTVTELIPGKKYRLAFSAGKDPITGKYCRVRETFMGTKRQAELRIELIRREREFAIELRDAGFPEQVVEHYGLTVAQACKNGMSVKEVCAEIERRREAERKVTFAEWCEQYLRNREGMGKVRKATLRQDRTQAKHLIAGLGSMPLNEIQPAVIEGFYVSQREAGMGDTTLLACHKLLKRVMKDAKKNHRIPYNPLDDVDAPKLPKPERNALSEGEARRLASIASSGTLTANKTCVFLGLSLGARLGEVLGLTWEHAVLDADRPFIHIVQQYTRFREISPLKTDKNDNPVGRIVPIDALTVAVLERWKAEQRMQLNALGIEQGKSTPIVSNTLGGWMEHSNFERWWRGFCIDNGFGFWADDAGRRIVPLRIGDDPEPYEGCVIEWRDAEGWHCDASGKRYSRSYKRPKLRRHYSGLRFHELRHTHFTMRLADGMDIPTAQALGGWSNPRILMSVYAHPVNDKIWKSAGFMNKLCAVN